MSPPSVIGDCRDVKRFLFFWSEGVDVPDVEGVFCPVGGISCTRSRASRSSESVCSSKASRLDLTVPEKSTGSCGIMANLERSECKLILEISRPSI